MNQQPLLISPRRRNETLDVDSSLLGLIGPWGGSLKETLALDEQWVTPSESEPLFESLGATLNETLLEGTGIPVALGEALLATAAAAAAVNETLLETGTIINGTLYAGANTSLGCELLVRYAESWQFFVFHDNGIVCTYC